MTTKATPPVCPASRKRHDKLQMTLLVSRGVAPRYACRACGWDYVPARDEWTWQGDGPAPALTLTARHCDNCGYDGPERNADAYPGEDCPQCGGEMAT